MEACSLARESTERSTVTASRSGRTPPDTRASGRTTKPTDLEPWCMLMAIFMKECGSTTKRMDKEHISTPTAQLTLEIGSRTSSMESVLRHGLMEPATTVTTKMAKKTEKVR